VRQSRLRPVVSGQWSQAEPPLFFFLVFFLYASRSDVFLEKPSSLGNYLLDSPSAERRIHCAQLHQIFRIRYSIEPPVKWTTAYVIDLHMNDGESIIRFNLAFAGK
jgi:hypothetical protein